MAYTIKQISNILNVNSETIRRWVRTGELIGIMSSKKKGYMIEEVDFRNFCDKHRKYRIRFIQFKLLGPITAIMMQTKTEEDRNQAIEFMHNRLKEKGML